MARAATRPMSRAEMSWSGLSVPMQCHIVAKPLPWRSGVRLSMKEVGRRMV